LRVSPQAPHFVGEIHTYSQQQTIGLIGNPAVFESITSTSPLQRRLLASSMNFRAPTIFSIFPPHSHHLPIQALIPHQEPFQACIGPLLFNPLRGQSNPQHRLCPGHVLPSREDVRNDTRAVFPAQRTSATTSIRPSTYRTCAVRVWSKLLSLRKIHVSFILPMFLWCSALWWLSTLRTWEISLEVAASENFIDWWKLNSL
jgi:hypothetical protein